MAKKLDELMRRTIQVLANLNHVCYDGLVLSSFVLQCYGLHLVSIERISYADPNGDGLALGRRHGCIIPAETTPAALF